MSTVPIISQQTKDALARKGYSSTSVYEANRLPEWATPRTNAYNLTTAFLFGASALGFLVTKKMKLAHQGFALAMGATVVFDYMQRRQLDATSPFSNKSSGTLEMELEKYPYFKKAFETVNGQLDTKISDLENEKAKLLEQ